MRGDYLVCNATKREYFDMEVFGDSSRNPFKYARFGEHYLYPFALVRLCVLWPGDNLWGHWQGDRLELVSLDVDSVDLVIETYRDISLFLLDSLCEDDPDFINEIVRRGLCDNRVCLPVTTALLTLLEDAQYKHFRQDGKRFHTEYSDPKIIPEGAEDRWGPIVASLREHYQQYYRGLNMAAPDHLASGTPL